MLHPDLIATFVEEYRHSEAAGADAAREKARRDLAQVEKKISGPPAASEPVSPLPSKIRNLSSALQDPDLKMEAAEALRKLVSEIRMVPHEGAANGHPIELAGELVGILALGEAKTTRPAQFARAVSVNLVAGVGFEPTTFRL